MAKIYQGWMCKTRQDLVNDGGQGLESKYRHVLIDTPTEITVCEVPKDFPVPQYPNDTPLVLIIAPESEFLSFIPRDLVFESRYGAIDHMLDVLNMEQQRIHDRYQVLMRQQES